VLEIGGGIGAIQTELLAAGAATGEVVELVGAYEPYAGELARERGLDARSSFVVADILEQPDSVEPAEIVVLNRVVCCSPDGVELTAIAARLTRRTLVLSYPRDVFWMRAAIGAMNAGFRILRRSFRTFVHPPEALAAAAESAGLVRTESGRGAAWEFAAFARLS
jgi:magnesium-protoporphyrin O-methyltransferase